MPARSLDMQQFQWLTADEKAAIRSWVIRHGLGQARSVDELDDGGLGFAVLTGTSTNGLDGCGHLVHHRREVAAAVVAGDPFPFPTADRYAEIAARAERGR